MSSLPPPHERAFASGLSAHPDPAEAVAEVVVQVSERLPGAPTMAVVFASGSAVAVLDQVVAAIDALLGPETLIGATAVGVLAGSEEIEEGDGLALWAATGVPATPVRLESLGGSPPLVVGLPDSGPGGLVEGSTLVVLADPYTFAVDAFVAELNESARPVHLVGGLASATGGPERNRLVLGSEVHLSGAVGLVLPPGVADPVVSQGCRPIGSPWVVTEAQGQMVHQLGGRQALERLNEVIESLSDTDRSAAARGLHVGIVANDQQATFDQGDFLIRGLLGADRGTGAVAIGDRAEVGQVLQFQVRDEASASSELDRLLSPVEGRGALVFTCNGRGSHLFSVANHDAARVHQSLGPAVAGMFCAGELGPIADRNAVHGFTATVLAFH
jgi:small ligand-binding sensory domain FIST